MKKYLSYFSFTSLLTTIISLLGFSSCETSMEMYGCPYAEIDLEGTVTDENGKAIEGVQVKLCYTYIEIHEGKDSVVNIFPNDSTLTDAYGKYTIKARGVMPGELIKWPANKGDSFSVNKESNYFLQVEDIDGEANGGLFTNTISKFETATIVQTQKPDKEWFEGAYTITQDITLSLKKD